MNLQQFLNENLKPPTDNIPGTPRKNAPTFAYYTVYGEWPKEWIRGISDAPKKKWHGLMVDAGLKDKWLEALNSLPVEIRATDEGKDKIRVAFVIFRLPEKYDKLAGKMVKNLRKFKDFKVEKDIGPLGRPRICVAAAIKKGDSNWEEWWSSLPKKILKAYRETIKEK